MPAPPRRPGGGRHRRQELLPRINSTLSGLTGVPTTEPRCQRNVLGGQQQLPATPTIEAFLIGESSRHRAVGRSVTATSWSITRPTFASVLPGVTLSAHAILVRKPGIDQVTAPLAARVLGGGVNSVPSASTMTGASGELDKLITNLWHREPRDALHQRRPRTGGHRRSVRHGVRQRQHVDQLSIGRGLKFMSKKSKVPDLNEPFRHQDHPRPRTRREFVAQGFMTGAATVIAPTLAGMLAYPRAARASLAPDIQTAVTNCNITTGAGKIPFHLLRPRGWRHIAGSNVLVGGPQRTAGFPHRRGL